jgi:hypothetical protein
MKSFSTFHPLIIAAATVILSTSQADAFGVRGGSAHMSAAAGPRGAAVSGSSTHMAAGPRGAAVSGSSTHMAAGQHGSAVQHSSGAAVAGPYGASASHSAKSGQISTAGGTNIKYGAAGSKVNGPMGGSAGRGAAAVNVTGPGGQSYTKATAGKGAVGPNGGAVGSVGSVKATNTYAGTKINASGTRAAVGPYGNGVSSSYRGGVAVGANGNRASGSVRTGTAYGPYGATASRYGTYHVNNSVMRTNSTYVRTSFTHYSTFTPTWYNSHPAAWFSAGWVAGRAWSAPTYSTFATFVALPPTPIVYDYGTTVVYQDNSVYIDGDRVASEEEFTQQAQTIADTGRKSEPSNIEEWQPLGVFAMTRGEEEAADKIFQLAVNKNGVIRGNYYDAFTDTTLPVFGSVDKKTQRAAWSIGEKKDIVYEAGIANLTKDESPALVHFGKENTQQFILVRLEKPEDK